MKVGRLDDLVWEQQSDEAIHSKSKGEGPRRRALRLIGAGVIVALIAAGLALWLSRPSRAPGDPGEHILQQLQPVSRAVPPGSTVNYEHFGEPHWDSWDGESGTFGWSDVVTQVGFSWSGTPSALLAYANAELTRLGWSAYSPTTENGVLGGSWSRTLNNGTMARAQLGIEPGGRSWVLVAQAPPLGPRAG